MAGLLHSIQKLRTYFPSLEKEETSTGYIFSLFILSLVSCALFLFDIILPFGLLYGPLLYCFTKRCSLRVFLCHALPYAVFIGVYFGIFVGSETVTLPKFLFDYYTCTALSLSSYSFLTLYSIVKMDFEGAEELKLSCELAILFLIGSFFVGTLLIMKMEDIGLGFRPGIFVYMLFLTILLLCSEFLISRKKRKPCKPFSYPVEGKIPERKWEINPEKLERYQKIIAKQFKKPDLYLKSSLTLEELSTELGIPKHHLSHYLNNYLGKSFYEFLADYRISYAREQLRKDKGITLEALAYECGFNSKTTFIKHFKNITGVLPSQYSEEQEKKSV